MGNNIILCNSFWKASWIFNYDFIWIVFYINGSLILIISMSQCI